MEKRRITASEFHVWLIDTIARLSVEGNKGALSLVQGEGR